MTESFMKRWWCMTCPGWRPRAGFGYIGPLMACRACIAKRERKSA